MPISNLAEFLPSDRVVQNHTGLTGAFDVTLRWPVTGDPVTDQGALFTALSDQLSLKLESATVPLEVLVIKSIHRPTSN